MTDTDPETKRPVKVLEFERRWFGFTDEERTLLLEQMDDRLRSSSECTTHDHAGRIEFLREQVAETRARNTELRGAVATKDHRIAELVTANAALEAKLNGVVDPENGAHRVAEADGFDTSMEWPCNFCPEWVTFHHFGAGGRWVHAATHRLSCDGAPHFATPRQPLPEEVR